MLITNHAGMGNVTVNGKELEKWKHYRMDTDRLAENEITRNEDVTDSANGRNGTQQEKRHWHNKKPLLNKGPTVFTGSSLC